MDSPQKPPSGRLGRPPGRKTFRETPAVKRARQFFELQFEGMKPTAAAKAVAAEWQVSESTVFKDYARHIERLVTAAERKAREAKIDHGRVFLRAHPDIANKVADIYRATLASNLKSIGDITGANAALAYDFSGDEWLILLAEFSSTLLRRSRTKTFP